MVKNVPEIDLISPRVLVCYRAKGYIGSSLDFGLVVTVFSSVMGLRNIPTKFTGSTIFGQVTSVFLKFRINFA